METVRINTHIVSYTVRADCSRSPADLSAGHYCHCDSRMHRPQASPQSTDVLVDHKVTEKGCSRMDSEGVVGAVRTVDVQP